MFNRRDTAFIVATTVLFASWSLQAVAAPAQHIDPVVVATGIGKPITSEELDQAAATRLFRLTSEEYNVRRAVLDEMIDKRLLQASAAARGVAVEEFLRQEVDAKVEEPTDEQVRLVFEGARAQFGSLSDDLILAQVGQRKSELLADLRRASSIQVLLPPPRLEVSPGGGPALGPTTAKVAIVEFSDFECPFCARAASTVRAVLSKYPEDVRLTYRHFPLPSHRNALQAAKAGFCAAKQGRFWEMHDVMFANASKLSPEDLAAYARQIGLEAKTFERCVSAADTETAVKADRDAGSSYGVSGTPVFFINGRYINGAVTLATFSTVIEDEIQRWAAKKATTPVPRKAAAGGVE